MEDVETFEKWLAQMIKDAQKKLHMTDKTLAYIFLREGTHYYLRDISKSVVGQFESDKPE